ncbi:toxin-antitoxin system YwqK family antitoxin [uncultured Cocleimonas sp.]|uniref:toxin-antitoxin system YwqK family antitoxin n=1 Tax=uncultured Cocleimonas sp. TaxID=1051587 RepID=UPI00260558C7|nr:hypothetical protein [uncultured Cocleimonas sp.]
MEVGWFEVIYNLLIKVKTMRAITQTITSLIFLVSVFSISADTRPITDSGVGSPITEKGILEFTVYVPSNGRPTEARAVRKINTNYYLVVSNSVNFSRYNRQGGRLINDACYEFNASPWPNPLGIFKSNQNVNVCNSGYNPQHQYRSKPFIPNGPLRFSIFDTDYRDNSGGLRVDVYRLDNKQQENYGNNIENQIFSECPKRNPGSKPTYKLDTNNNPKDNTYISCFYFKDGALKYQSSYLNGKKHGKFITYDEVITNGEHLRQTLRNYRNGKQHGIQSYTAFCMKGGKSIRYKSSDYFYINGKKDNSATIQYKSPCSQ